MRNSEIILLAADLSPGESIRDTCPFCGGGSKQEQSFVVTRDEDNSLVWVCHRASCGAKGSTRRGTTAQHTPTSTPKPKKKFTGSTEALSERLKDHIYRLWGISEPEHWYWTPQYGGRVAMSVRSPKYHHRGWVLRDVRGRSSVKALTYIDEGEEGLSWYKTTPGAPTVIVEDIPSALRAGTYVNSVALLGTGVGLSRAEEIASYATRPIVVALDQDATSTAFKIARRYALLWGDVEVLMLDKDIKDMEETCIMKLFEKYNA